MTHTSTEQPEELLATELSEIIIRRNHLRADMPVHVLIQSQGEVGANASVAVTGAHWGFDWNAGKLLISTSVPLTTLTQEQVADICTSVRKGGSWHAYQKWKAQQEEIRQLRARIAELEATQAQRAPLPEVIPSSPTLWAFLTKGMTLSAIEQLPNEHDKKVYLDRAAKNWAAIRSECITQEKQG